MKSQLLQKSLIIAALLVLAIASPSHAQTVAVSRSATAPTDNLAFSQTTFTDLGGGVAAVYSWNNTSGSSFRDIMQSFTPSVGYTLDKVTFQIGGGLYTASRAALSGASVNVTLVTLSSNVTSGLTVVPNSSVSLGTGVFPDMTSAATSDYLTFDVNNTALTGGTTYGIVLSFVNSASDQAIPLVIKYGTVGSVGGNIYIHDQNSAANTFTSVSNEYLFYLQSAPSSIPEPSATAMILGLACGSLVFIRRHRCRTVQ
ncbi:MAG: hypothetical protein WC205_13435 [Opitutaceae bacterium]